MNRCGTGVKKQLTARQHFERRSCWLVADKYGCWNKHGLDVYTSPQLVRELDDSGYNDQLYQSTEAIRGLAVKSKQN